MKNERTVKEIYDDSRTLSEFLGYFHSIFLGPSTSDKSTGFIFAIPDHVEIDIDKEQIQEQCELILEYLPWENVWQVYRNCRLHHIRFTK